MSWMDILKADIDFETFESGRGSLGTFTGSEKIPPKIKVYLPDIFESLKRKLKRKPTDREFEEFVKYIIRHEASHAGHFEADFDSLWEGKGKQEYVADMLAFPHNPYYGLKQMIENAGFRGEGGEIVDILPSGWADRVNPDTERVAAVKKLVNYVDKWAHNEKDKNQLVKLELAMRKFNPEERWKYKHERYPINYSTAYNRYFPFINRQDRASHFPPSIIKFLKRIFGEE